MGFQRILIRIILFLLIFTGSSLEVLGITEDEKNNIAIYKKAAPAVVNISSVVLERDFFFNVIPREGAGSGAIVDKKGYILTNHHVIKYASKVEVTLEDGSKWPGRLVGSDPENDLAVIKIDAPRGKLVILPLGDSSALKVGQKVLAIGNPFGLGQTLTTGIISFVGRRIKADSGLMIDEVIQTDAAINPGNSGGPLLDSNGRIIGINSAIISPTGASVGIGFAIPVNTAKRVLPDLISRGYVAYPWLGVSVYPLLPGFAEALDLKVERGAVVAEVVRGGPAYHAGLRGGDKVVQVGNSLLPIGGDVVTAMDGKEVYSSDELIRMVREHRPGDMVTLRILRGNRFMDVPLKLTERPKR
jgi:putative serine protease PepD